jgi:hypothetical protein
MDKYRAEFIYKTAPALGLTEEQAYTILRAAQTLHTWAVHECNGTKHREEVQDATTGQWHETGRVHWYNPNTGNKCGRAVDLEAGALRRVESVCKSAGLTFEHQGDPRGYVLKLIKDVREYGVPSRG